MATVAMKKTFTPIQALWFFLYVGVAYFFLALPMVQSPDAWYASFWLFDYNFGFLKRGLIGELLSLLCGNECRTFKFIVDLSYITLYLLTFVVCIFSFLAFYRNRLIGLVFIASGFAIQQFSYDIGRLDQINYLLLFCCLFILFYVKNNYFVFVVFILLASGMLLVHEASLFMQVPVLISILLLSLLQSGKLAEFHIRLLVVIWLFLLSFIFVGVIASGNVDVAKAEQIESRLLLVDGFSGPYVDKVKNAVWVQTSSVSDNIELTMNKALKMKTISRLLMVIGVSLPILFLLVSIFRQVKHDRQYLCMAMCLPIIGALPLFITGCDWYRWIAMLFFNLMIVLGFFLHKWKLSLVVNKKTIVLALVFSIYSGPYGITHALPERMRTLHSVEKYIELLRSENNVAIRTLHAYPLGT